MQLHFIRKAEKKRIAEKLKEQFGISEIPFLLLKSGREKIRAYSGSLSKDEILELGKCVNIESLGLYFAKQEKGQDAEIRLSVDAIHLLREQVSKRIIEVDKQQADDWLRGRDIEIGKDFKGFVILKHENDFIGCGRMSAGRITNFVPKERRIKS